MSAVKTQSEFIMISLKDTATTVLLLLCGVLLSACNRDDAPAWDNTPTDHTLLIYIVGDNTLSDDARINIRRACEGYLQAPDNINIVIYKDNLGSFHASADDANPMLLHLRRNLNTQTVETDTLYRWPSDHDSASPEVLRNVLEMTFQRFNTRVKGLDLWSHGMAWIPSQKFLPSPSALTRSFAGGGDVAQPDYFGQDGNDYMELWELRQAIQGVQGLHLDYILFDACNMASIEVAYELADLCDYQMASATEILSDGFPYTNVIYQLSKAPGNASVEEALTGVFEAFHQHYANNGTLSIIDSRKLEPIAERYATLLAGAKPYLQELSQQQGYTLQQNWQHFGGKRVGSYYYFYDLQEISDLLAAHQEMGAMPSGMEDLLQGQAVLQTYHASSYATNGERYSYPLSRCCGIMVSIPQLFWLRDAYNATSGTATSAQMQDAYPLTRWHQRMMKQ